MIDRDSELGKVLLTIWREQGFNPEMITDIYTWKAGAPGVVGLTTYVGLMANPKPKPSWPRSLFWEPTVQIAVHQNQLVEYLVIRSIKKTDDSAI